MHPPGEAGAPVAEAPASVVCDLVAGVAGGTASRKPLNARGPGHRRGSPEGEGASAPCRSEETVPAGSCGVAEPGVGPAASAGGRGQRSPARRPHRGDLGPGTCGRVPEALWRVTAAPLQGGGDSESGTAGPPSRDRAGTRTRVYVALNPTSSSLQPEPLRGNTGHQCPGDCRDTGTSRWTGTAAAGPSGSEGTQGPMGPDTVGPTPGCCVPPASLLHVCVPSST